MELKRAERKRYLFQRSERLTCLRDPVSQAQQPQQDPWTPEASLPFSEKGEPLSGYHPHYISQITTGLGTSSLKEARQVAKSGKLEHKAGNRFMNSSSSNFWGTVMKTKLHLCYIYVGTSI